MKRILLKLSGEALAAEQHTGFDEATCRRVAAQIAGIVREGTGVGIVIGGGNFWRGAGKSMMDRVKADQIGMLATVMNCIYMSEMLRAEGVESRIMTPFAVDGFAEVFSKDQVRRSFAAGEVVFFAGGTGHPYFSTDTATVLRAIEIEADAILLAKNIDGVYDSDPAVNPAAKRFDTISIQEVLDRQLGVIDLSASLMCSQNHMPLYIFALNEEDSIKKAAAGKFNGTVVTVE